MNDNNIMLFCFCLLFLFRFQFKKNLRRIVSQLYVRDNCHPFKASVLVWVQLPLWISLSLALRNLSLGQSGKLILTLDQSWTRNLFLQLTTVNCFLQRCSLIWQQGALCGSLTSPHLTSPGSYLSVLDSPTCSS